MKDYCMSSYLAYRTIFEEGRTFLPNRKNSYYKPILPTHYISNGIELGKFFADYISKEFILNKSAVFLSGGIDSAIVASYLPKGTKAYTFKCIAEGAIDETMQAKKYTDKYQLDHEVIEITWDDILELTPKLMEYDGMPMHSIEALVYKGCLTAKKAGIEKIFIGNSADPIYGGMDKLLSQDWTYEDFINRYMFLDPKKVLKNPVSVDHIFEPYKRENDIDFVDFVQTVFGLESSTSYLHAATLAGIKIADPFANTSMKEALDLKRVRNGESKYIVRELFAQRFPDIKIPEKTPMPRAVGQWLKDWEGPIRPEFLPNCVEGCTGDQKWQLFCLEWFLNLYDL